LLRGTQDGPLFCQECHGEVSRGDSRAWHVVVAQSAHGGEPGAEAAARGTLDPLSTRCMGCHDGTLGRDVGSQTGRRRLDVGLGSSHPVGVAYRASPARRKQGQRGPALRDVALLDPRIRLFGGKVGCGSCHNVYSELPQFLAIDPRHGRLCRACHAI
jgi:hypothetical protein